MAGLRYENKYLLHTSAALVLRPRLEAIAALDKHAGNGAYFIRSLYFDDIQNIALHEKIDGVEKREKWRIRYYNRDTSFLVLESKQKLGKMTRKLSARLTLRQAIELQNGNPSVLYGCDDPVLQRFYHQAAMHILRPCVIVDYTRVPFVFRDVRITFDVNLHSGNQSVDFLNPNIPTIPVFPGDRMILEVKYNEKLPDTFRRALSAVPTPPIAVSKFRLCRQMQ
ncbi:MAG: polyphosphate polymerase domain-containing protein [Oscillospiraceae bacterium]|jgi:hypothetical protein|nr:polyphosphate polymerase domain-containing protein [Oscillospiraceae bacterium]